jgi:hypothetical protein
MFEVKAFQMAGIISHSYIHKMQSTLMIITYAADDDSDAPTCYYNEINALAATASNQWNKCKTHEEIIGNTHARYLLYPNGRVMVFIE